MAGPRVAPGKANSEAVGRRQLLLGGAAALATTACRRLRGTPAPSASASSPASAPSPIRSAAPPAPRTPDGGSPEYTELANDLSRDGRWLAVGAGSAPDDYDAGGPLVLWDVLLRAPIRRRVVAPGGIGLKGRGLLSFSPSGRLLVGRCNTNEVHVFDATSDTLATAGEVALSHDDSAPGACLLPGERTLFTRGERGLAIVPAKGNHHVDTPGVRWFPDEGASFPFYVVGARADGIVVGAHPHGAKAFDTMTGKVVWISTEVTGGSDADWALSRDATRLVAATGAEIVVLETAHGRVVARNAVPHASSSTVEWDPAGKRVAVARVSDVTIYDGLALLCRLPSVPRKRPWLMAPDLRSFAFSLDGTRGVVATESGAIVVYELGGSPRRLAETPLVAEPKEWLGVLWGAGDTVVAITSKEIVFLDGKRGGVHARSPLGFPIQRDV